MADFVFDKFKEALGGYDPTAGAGDVVSLLWHSSLSGASTIEAALIIGELQDVSGIKTAVDVTAALADSSVAEYASVTGYARKAVTGRTISTSTPVVTFSAATIPTWSSLAPNTTDPGSSGVDCDGVLLIWNPPSTAGDGDNVPLMYFDLKNASTTLAFNGSNGDVTITHASGMVTLT